jgi:taurine dioxygenase
LTLTITPTLDGFVAELTSWGGGLSVDAAGQPIIDALRSHAVVVLRDVRLTPADQVALTRHLGEPEVVTDMRNHHPESTYVLVVNNLAITPVVGNQWWHSDASFLPRPVRYTVLCSELVPASGGGTMFADMVGAFRGAPEGWKDGLPGAMGVHAYNRIARLRAKIHSKPLETDYEEKFPPVRHPVIRTHPETATPALFLNPLCLERVESAEGEPLDISVDDLHAYATDERFVYRHEWQAGDVLIWDNARVLHRAVDLPPDLPRVLHRTSTIGELPQAYKPLAT